MKNYDLVPFIAACVATISAIGNVVLTILHAIGKI